MAGPSLVEPWTKSVHTGTRDWTAAAAVAATYEAAGMCGQEAQDPFPWPHTMLAGYWYRIQ